MKKSAGMGSIKTLYRIGKGPSSSHTMGPEAAAERFKAKNPDADAFEVTLFGSLARTGRGHMTDKIIELTLAPKPCRIIFNADRKDLPHPNTMVFRALKNGKVIDTEEIYSIGGGEIRIKGAPHEDEPIVYRGRTFEEIYKICRHDNIRLWQYVQLTEGPEIWEYLSRVWETMQSAVSNGLAAEGELSGGLGVLRKAKYLCSCGSENEAPETRKDRLICAYAFAVSEENAAGGTVVTAPTCGSCGVLPAVLKYEKDERGFSDEDILHALATAGVIGNIIRTNASISGAECGCQAEIGSACSMAAAAVAELLGMDIEQIEYAAEVAMEHHLGLTCDPIRGLVQIPCIERNAVAACRAINAVHLSNFLHNTRKISFDLVVQTMYETGRDLSGIYRETGEGGLAKLYE